MRSRINQIAALFLIYLLMASPLSLAQEEQPQPDEISTTDEEFQYENAFNNNPTPENFDKLPNPAAADLEKVPNPTLGNFKRLSSTEQGKYLSNENKYNLEFADQYYSNPVNWGTNNLADNVFFKQETGLRDFLKKGASKKDAAQQYFTKNFGAPYHFTDIADDFFFDNQKGILKNGLTNLVLAEFKNDISITGIASTNNGFEISRKIDEKEQKVSVAGTEAKTVSYDKEKGTFLFQLPDGGKQTFEIPNDAQVTFTFEAEKVTVDGPASGIVNTKGDYAQFINHEGKLIINYNNGDLDAEDAEVITSRLFLDGRYSKKGNNIEAWDVGRGGKKTVVVDKNACPEAGACVGVSTQGQWDARYLPEKDQNKASTLKINLDKVSLTSSFYNDPNKPQPTEEEKAKQLREQAQQLRKPAQPPLQGNNAEVWINKDEASQAITVTSKGVVAVGLYDARGNAAEQLNDKFSYKGLSGLSELDVQFAARTQTNVRGQAELKNDQFREGILTNQDGAVIKVNHDNFRPDQADAVRAECFDCKEGEAMVIQKSVVVAKETGTPGVFAGTNRAGVRLSINIDEKGKIIFTPDKTDLGFLADQIPEEGQEVSIGNNLFVSVPCGEIECSFKLSRDPRTAEVGAAFEFVDPKNPETVIKRIEYPLTVGTVLGNEAIMVSEQNAAEVNRLTVLIEEGKFNELPKLSFDKEDPAYATLKKKFLTESGLNLDALSDQRYGRELQTITETTQRAKETYKKYGIELDALGNFKTREDAEKYQQIVNKGLGADVDELTRAKWDLARMRIKEVEGLLAACQGTSYCSVSEKDLKAAKEEESKTLRIRTANYDRWKVLTQKAELERKLKDADERAKRDDKGIDATDKKELEDTKRKIDHGEKRKIDLDKTLEAQTRRKNEGLATIRSKLESGWAGIRGKEGEIIKGGATLLAIDWNRFNSDPDYAISLVNKYAPRGFISNKLDADTIVLRENLRADAQAATETQKKLDQVNTDIKGLESQNQALIDKYRMEGKEDVAAEAALLAGKYKEVQDIISGPSFAAETGIKEVVKLGKDKDGNVVEVEKIDVSVLAGQKTISDHHAKDLIDRAIRQQRDETLDQAALLYDYGRGNEAGAVLQEVVSANPQLAKELEEAKNVPDSILNPDLVKLKKTQMAQAAYSKRVLEERENELEQANHLARLKKEEEDLGAGKAVARAWKNIGASSDFTGAVAETVALGGHSFSFLFDSSEKAAADALGITKVRDDLDQQAFQEQERQIAQLHRLRFKLKEYDSKGLSPAQAFADARVGVDRGADGKVASSSPELQISVADEPAAALLEFDLTKSIFSEEDKKFLAASDDILAKSNLIQQRKEQYELARKELEFNTVVREAENAQRFNRDKLAGEAAAKYKEALAVCADCAGAKNVQRQLDTLNQNFLGEVIAVYTGEAAGKTIAGGLERVGVTYTRETEEEFRDMAISSFDALVVFDVGELVIGGPLALADTLQKLRKVSKSVDAAGTAIDAYKYASKGTREAFSAAKAAERAADSAEAIAEARKAVQTVKEALAAEIKAGREASKYQQFQRAVNTPLGAVDRDVAKARNVELDIIGAQTQDLNLARRELDTARVSGDTLAEGQALVKISDAQEAIGASAKTIDELDDLLRVSKIAGPKNGAVRKAWDATFRKVFGSSAEDEVLVAEQDFRRAADNFAEASANARLVGDTDEAIISRTRLDAAKEQLEVAAQKVDDAYLNRKVEKSKSAIQQRLQQAQVSGAGDEVFDAVGAEGAAKLDGVAGNPSVRVEPDGTGLRFELPEEAPPQLRIEVEEGNKLLLKIDTSEARAEAELEEQLLETIADSEYVAAHDVKARRLEAAGVERPESIISDAVNPCNLAAAAIYGLAPCELKTGAATPLAKGRPEVGEHISLATIVPQRVPGQYDWNEIVNIIEHNPSGKLDDASLEALVSKKELYIGGGGEGVVLDVPEAVRTQLPGVERPSIIKIKNIDPSLEDIANSFPEQQKILNRLAERGAAPHVYEAGDNFYIAEKIEGDSLKKTIAEHLSPGGQAEYEAAYVKYDEARKLEVENPILVKETRREIERILRRASYEGELDEVQEAVQKLADSLIAENIEVADFHWENVMVIKNPDGKLKAELLDAGFAIPGDPATIKRTYAKKLDELMTGGGYAVNSQVIKEAKSERSFARVSDVIEPCAVAGGAIYGMAPCFPEKVIPSPPPSGERVVRTEPIIEEKPIPLDQIQESITPEKRITLQRIIREKDGIVIQSENNFYFIDKNGKVSTTYLDDSFTFRPGKTASIDPAAQQQLSGLAEEVRTGRVVPLEVSPEEKDKIFLTKLTQDKEVSLLIGSPEYDKVFINPHGTHQQYLDKIDDTIESNRNLQYLHEKFAEKGIPVNYNPTEPEPHLTAVLASYSQEDGSIRYKIFADEGEIAAEVKKSGYQGNNIAEAKKIIAQKQAQIAAGHETYHHAFESYLTPKQQAAWIRYVQQTNDPAIRSAVNSLTRTTTYKDIARGLSSEEAWGLVADEVFAFRNDFHAFEARGIAGMELPASQQELRLLKQFQVLPPDYTVPTPRTIGDLLKQPGTQFRLQTNTLGSIGGKFKSSEYLVDTITYSVEEERGGFLGNIFKTKTTTQTVPISEINPSNLIFEGDSVRVKVNGQKVYGTYAGEDADNLKLLDEKGNPILLAKKDVNFDSLIKVPGVTKESRNFAGTGIGIEPAPCIGTAC